MKNQTLDNWIDDFIVNEELSDETIYAIYDFLLQLLLTFEMRGFHRPRSYAKEQEEINKGRYEIKNNEDPF